MGCVVKYWLSRILLHFHRNAAEKIIKQPKLPLPAQNNVVDVVCTVNGSFFALKTRSSIASVIINLTVTKALSCHLCDVELS